MKNNRFAVIAALECEEELIRKELKGISETVLLNTPVYEGMIGEYDIVLMRCGIGMVSAAIGAQALIDMYHPDYIINSGCAGALDPDLGIGDVVISDSVSEWNLDLRAIGFPMGYVDALKTVEMKASDELCNMIDNAIPDDIKVRKGKVVSADQFVSTADQRAFITDNFPDALCAEMEGAAVGHVCTQNNVPFCIIRTMSDTADGNSGVNFAEFSAAAGRKSAEWLINMFRK